MGISRTVASASARSITSRARSISTGVNAWFAAGLGSFLLAHLLFVGAFLQGLSRFPIPGPVWLIVPYGVGLLWLLLPRAGPLKIPVVIYCAVITAMVVTAATRPMRCSRPR